MASESQQRLELAELRELDRQAAQEELRRAESAMRKAMARFRAAQERVRILNEPLIKQYTQQVALMDQPRVTWSGR